MVQVDVKLFGSLRSLLPPKAKGRTHLSLQPDTSIEDLLNRLGVHDHVTVAVNEVYDDNLARQLADGDQVMIFEISAGG